MLRIGVVGLGRMGCDHIQRLQSHVGRATIAGVFDADKEKCAHFERTYGYHVFKDYKSLVEDKTIDAVLIASPGHLHASQILDCISAGKPTLCEKPLASTSTDAWQVVQEEVARGKRFVQLGFMRRFDNAFLDLRASVHSGSVGTPLLMHCVHRNPSVRQGYVSLNSLDDSLTHEIDIARWILQEEIVSARVVLPKPSPLSPGLQDPKVILLETQSGVVVDIEIFVTCQYGYDVRCEVVGSEGIASIMPEKSRVDVLAAGRNQSKITANWSERFGESYARELVAWVDATLSGEVIGPSAWDGYAASLTAEKCVESLQTGKQVEIRIDPTPELYCTAQDVSHFADVA